MHKTVPCDPPWALELEIQRFNFPFNNLLKTYSDSGTAGGCGSGFGRGCVSEFGPGLCGGVGR